MAHYRLGILQTESGVVLTVSWRNIPITLKSLVVNTFGFPHLISLTFTSDRWVEYFVSSRRKLRTSFV